jgi:hypothetical protein
MASFLQFWSDLGWLANLTGICFAALPIFGISKLAINNYKKISLKKINEARYKLNKRMNNESYLSWQQNLFESVYTESEFVELYGKKYPATIIRSSVEHPHPYPFNNLCILQSMDIVDYKLSRTQKKYLKYLGDSVKRPKMSGFSLKEISLDLNGKLDCISAIASNYEQNIVTAHILEWELFKFYEKNKNKQNDFYSVIRKLKYRSIYHGTRNPSSALLIPSNAFPLISVQALIIYKDYQLTKLTKKMEWKAVVAQRQKNVAIKPDLWQIQPAGGFEVLGHESDDSKIVLKQGFDIRLALLREYAEELFNIPELDFCDDGRDFYSILSQENIAQLIKLIDQGKASFEFLGIITDLTILRPEVSFLIVIDDEEYSEKTKIIGSSESVKICSLSMGDLKDIFSTEKVHSSSAGLLQLALESDRLRDLGIATELK